VIVKDLRVVERRVLPGLNRSSQRCVGRVTVGVCG
jgi:hypothetical protein